MKVKAMTAISSCAILLMVLVGLIGFWGARNFNRELRKSHPVQWEYLGRPTSNSVRSFQQEVRWIGFVVLRRYSKLGDRRLSAFGNLVLICGLINVTILVSWAFIPHGPAPVLG